MNILNKRKSFGRVCKVMVFSIFVAIISATALPVYGIDFGGQFKKLKKSVRGLNDDLAVEKKHLKKNTKKVKKVGKDGVKAVKKTFEDFTPEQEYYIGRAVAASIFSKYKPYNNKKANMYLNLLGQTLAQASDMPETFGGYHFMILDSDEINAFAAPGGLVMVTRGMLRCCRSEDAVAAVLAHEIGHVQYKHGLQAIKKSRVASVLTVVAIVGASIVAGEQLSGLTTSFGGSITDIVSVVNNGYSRSFERRADKAAVTIMKRVGYEPNGIIEMLNEMKNNLKPGGIDFVKTHPSPASRIVDLQKTVGSYSKIKTPQKRQVRFNKALGKI